MFANRRCRPTIPALDIGRARRWYDEKLGLKAAEESPFGLVYDLGGGTGFLLYPTEFAGKAPNTLMSFVSDDVEGDVAALKKKGVVFDELEGGGLDTVNSIATMGDLKAAWFRDSEGNILAVGNEGRAA